MTIHELRVRLIATVKRIGVAYLLTVITIAASPTRPAFGQPNIIVIVSDDAGYADYGFSASVNNTVTDVRTPNLDALAAQSSVLTSGYVAAPLCSPSRVGLLTGQYQQRIGYENNPGSLDGLPAGQQLISHHLQDLGYTTGAIGKWHLGEIDNVNRPLDMGFDEFYGFLGGSRSFFGSPGNQRQAMRRGDTSIATQWLSEGDQSRYDPVYGRYVTDAFGEEAADFINRHAGDDTPFFLYVALTAPHTPFQAKQSDLNEFSDIADPLRRTIAAMNYALDRAVGDITTALASNGVDDNTIIVFTNDNGAAVDGPYNNGPFRGTKGQLWEGGIRVPFMIKAPGVAPGFYDEAVSTIDLMPTFINAAGGDADQVPHDGKDIMPFISGEVGGDPHEIMFWRHNDGLFIVRKGDWKLVRPGQNSTFARLHNLASDIHEDNYVNSQHPELVEELLRELTIWEATLRKPEFGSGGAYQNRFDHFVFRNDLATTSNWSTSSVWKEAGTDTNRTFFSEDAYANAILEFSVRNDAGYTATNDMKRTTAQTFMLNQIRLTGDFAGTTNQNGTINGNSLLFVKSLDGQLPKLQLTATAVSSSASFQFAVNNELQLLDDLEITGDGTEEFLVGGNIRDYYMPRNVIKSGSSSVTLAGNNSFRGSLIINEGRVKASNTAGSVENNGGIFAPGAAPGLTAMIHGSFAQNSGTLEVEIGGTVAGAEYDKITVNGSATLGGALAVELTNGFMPQLGHSFELITAGVGVTASFDNLILPTIEEGMWGIEYGPTSVFLFVTFEGDFNGDRAVDAADYVVWRKTLGTTAGYNAWRQHFTFERDFNGDRAVDAADYVVWRKTLGTTAGYNAWRQHFGQSIPTSAAGSEASVPECSSKGLAIICALSLLTCRSRSWRTFLVID